MNDQKDKPEEHSPQSLLERAYSLENDDDMHALYGDWATSYDATMLDGLHYFTPQRTADLLAQYITRPTLDVGTIQGSPFSNALRQQIGISRRRKHPRAPRKQHLDDGRTDALGSAGHKRALAVQAP